MSRDFRHLHFVCRAADGEPRSAHFYKMDAVAALIEPTAGFMVSLADRDGKVIAWRAELMGLSLHEAMAKVG